MIFIRSINGAENIGIAKFMLIVSLAELLFKLNEYVGDEVVNR